MDIFKYARSIDWKADYFDQHTGYIYMLTEASEYNYEKIPVYDTASNSYIGFVSSEQ